VLSQGAYPKEEALPRAYQEVLKRARGTTKYRFGVLHTSHGYQLVQKNVLIVHCIFCFQPIRCQFSPMDIRFDHKDPNSDCPGTKAQSPYALFEDCIEDTTDIDSQDSDEDLDSYQMALNPLDENAAYRFCEILGLHERDLTVDRASLQPEILEIMESAADGEEIDRHLATFADTFNSPNTSRLEKYLTDFLNTIGTRNALNRTPWSAIMTGLTLRGILSPKQVQTLRAEYNYPELKHVGRLTRGVMHNSIYICLVGIQRMRFRKTSEDGPLCGILTLILLIKCGLATYPARREKQHLENIVRRINPATCRNGRRRECTEYCRCMIHRFDHIDNRMCSTATDNLTSAEDALFDQLKSDERGLYMGSQFYLGKLPPRRAAVPGESPKKAPQYSMEIYGVPISIEIRNGKVVGDNLSHVNGAVVELCKALLHAQASHDVDSACNTVVSEHWNEPLQRAFGKRCMNAVLGDRRIMRYFHGAALSEFSVFRDFTARMSQDLYACVKKVQVRIGKERWQQAEKRTEEWKKRAEELVEQLSEKNAQLDEKGEMIDEAMGCIEKLQYRCKLLEKKLRSALGSEAYGDVIKEIDLEEELLSVHQTLKTKDTTPVVATAMEIIEQFLDLPEEYATESEDSSDEEPNEESEDESDEESKVEPDEKPTGGVDGLIESMQKLVLDLSQVASAELRVRITCATQYIHKELADAEFYDWIDESSVEQHKKLDMLRCIKDHIREPVRPLRPP
jgi:hypothetical protein